MQNPIQKQLKLISSDCEKLNINYIAYLQCPDNDIRDLKYFSTEDEWGDLYYEKGLILDCPLVHYGLTIKSKDFILPWSSVPPLTKKEKYVTGVRKNDFSLHNGISFVSKIKNKTFSIAFATHYKSMDFYEEICENETVITAMINIIKDGFI